MDTPAGQYPWWWCYEVCRGWTHPPGSTHGGSVMRGVVDGHTRQAVPMVVVLSGVSWMDTPAGQYPWW